MSEEDIPISLLSISQSQQKIIIQKILKQFDDQWNRSVDYLLSYYGRSFIDQFTDLYGYALERKDKNYRQEKDYLQKKGDTHKQIVRLLQHSILSIVNDYLKNNMRSQERYKVKEHINEFIRRNILKYLQYIFKIDELLIAICNKSSLKQKLEYTKILYKRTKQKYQELKALIETKKEKSYSTPIIDRDQLDLRYNDIQSKQYSGKYDDYQRREEVQEKATNLVLNQERRNHLGLNQQKANNLGLNQEKINNLPPRQVKINEQISDKQITSHVTPGNRKLMRIVEEEKHTTPGKPKNQKQQVNPTSPKIKSQQVQKEHSNLQSLNKDKIQIQKQQSSKQISQNSYNQPQNYIAGQQINKKTSAGSYPSTTPTPTNYYVYGNSKPQQTFIGSQVLNQGQKNFDEKKQLFKTNIYNVVQNNFSTYLGSKTHKGIELTSNGAIGAAEKKTITNGYGQYGYGQYGNYNR